MPSASVYKFSANSKYWIVRYDKFAQSIQWQWMLARLPWVNSKSNNTRSEIEWRMFPLFILIWMGVAYDNMLPIAKANCHRNTNTAL